jgi:hypothetical protein
MEPANSFSKEEQSRMLEMVFQIFASNQEDLALSIDPDESAADTEKETEASD